MNLLRPFTLAAEDDPARKNKHTVTLIGSAAVTSVTEKAFSFPPLLRTLGTFF